MGVAEQVKRLLSAHSHVLWRNARFQSPQGGCFEVGILMALWAGNEFRLAALECKSPGMLTEEEVSQIRRVASVLNLGGVRWCFPSLSARRRSACGLSKRASAWRASQASRRSCRA